MKKPNIIELIKVDTHSVTPKYLQIVNCVLREIENGNISNGDTFPSINDLNIKLDVARDTVEKGYRHLKHIGIIDSVPRRGYFVKNATLQQPLKIFLLFNKLSGHKKIIYDSFITTIGIHAVIDFYIYNNDFMLFRKLINDSKKDYTHYVIIPHFMEGEENGHEVVNRIPKEKLLLLDKMLPGVEGEYASAYENFEKDIYNALIQASDRLVNYHTLKIIVPSYSYYPVEIVRGFKNFCQDYAFSYKIVHNIKEDVIQEGDVFLNVMEDELVIVLEKIIASGLTIGKEVGIISYNETRVKKFILNGITTISTDFHQMGITAAQLILTKSKQQLEIPFKLTLRASL